MDVDDVAAITEGGGRIVVQVKGALRLSAAPRSPFAKAVNQVVAQFIRGFDDQAGRRDLDPLRDRLVIAGDRRSSEPIRQTVAMTDRLRTLPSELPLGSACTNADQDRALPILLDRIRVAWRELTGVDPLENEIRSLLKVLGVAVANLHDSGADEESALVHLRSILVDPRQAAAAWSELKSISQSLAENRSWTNRAAIVARLASVGIAVGPAPSLSADIQRLRRITKSNLALLRSNASLPSSGGPITCDRREVSESLTADGNFVIVGEPGCGKSGMLYEIAERLRATEDVVVLTVDNLPSSAGGARVELGLQSDLADVLAGWSGDRRATLVLDGLDAARGEASSWLGRLCESLSASRWRVLASIRRFDLRHSTMWQQAFRGEPLGTTEGKRAPELGSVRHLLLGELSDLELSQLASTSTEIAALLKGTPKHLVELLRNPFNLRLAVELLDAGSTVASLADTRDQLHLLQRYWRLRVTDGAGRDTRERALLGVTRAMLRSRRLRADRTIISDTLLPAIADLLARGVLREVAPVLLAQGAGALVFSHHILFDFTVSALVFTDTEGSCLAAQLADDPNLAVIARPSIDLHLADMWHADEHRHLFASVCHDLVDSDHALAGIAAARAMLDGVQAAQDVRWLIEDLANQPGKATRFAGWLVAVMDAARDDQGPRIHSHVDLWADLAVALADALERKFEPELGQVLFRLLWLLEDIDPLGPAAVAALKRAASCGRLMSAALEDTQGRVWLGLRAAQLLPRAVSADPAQAATLRRTLVPEIRNAIGAEVMRHYVQGIRFVSAGDPDVATEVLCALWGWDEDRDEETYLSQGVLNLVSNRKQDLDHTKWLSGEKFQEFLQSAGLGRAVKVVGAVARGADSQIDRQALMLEAFGARGRLRHSIHPLQYGPGMGAAAKIIDEFATALTQASEPEIEPLMAEMITHIDSFEVWSRVLEVGIDEPLWLRPMGAVLSSGALLFNTQTRPAAARLLAALSQAVSADEHNASVEGPIHRAIAMCPPEESEWTQYVLDELLEHLEPAHLQDQTLQRRASKLHRSRDSDARRSAGEQISSDSFDDDESDTPKNHLQDLRALVATCKANPNQEAVAELTATFEEVVGDKGSFDESALWRIAEAANEIAGSDLASPDSELGATVFKLLVEILQSPPGESS